MARGYTQNKSVQSQQLAVVHPKEVSAELEAWEDGRLLHGLADASTILTHKLGGGYSEPQLRRRIKHGRLGEAGLVWFYDGQYKINLKRFMEWRNQNPDERQLRG
jgi:hypothetical protein